MTKEVLQYTKGHQITDKKTLWVAYTTYTNTDCTQGAGIDVPIAVCTAKATAIRLAKKKYVQGGDGPVRAVEALKIDGKWYAPSVAFNLVLPSSEDVYAEAAINAKSLALEKAKAAGLTDADLLAMGIQV